MLSVRHWVVVQLHASESNDTICEKQATKPFTALAQAKHAKVLSAEGVG